MGHIAQINIQKLIKFTESYSNRGKFFKIKNIIDK